MFQTKPEPAQEVTELLQNGRPWYDPTRKAVLLRDNNKLTAVFIESEIAVNARVRHIHNEYYINFQMQVPKSFADRIRGFLGNLDGDPTNDFIKRGEMNPLPNNIRERDLLNEFQTCKFCMIKVNY